MNTYTAAIVIASTRASAGVYADRTGPIIAEWLAARNFAPVCPQVVPDGEPVGVALQEAIAQGVNLVITSGGTGITPTDRTPEQTRKVLDYELPGLAEAIRRSGLPQVPTSILSRGLCGVANRTLIINLPGSTGGVRDGLEVLGGVIDHALEQIQGGDH